MFNKLTLYSTACCHLCDEALEMLHSLQLNPINLVEIADNELLLSIYGTRIPVLQRLDNLAELNWPFDNDDIANFLKTK